jgi:hypothetical protein
LKALYVPLGHSRHAVPLEAPVVGLYVPEGHGVGRPATQYRPVGHGTPCADVLRRLHSTPSPQRPLHVAVDSWLMLPKYLHIQERSGGGARERLHSVMRGELSGAPSAHSQGGG